MIEPDHRCAWTNRRRSELSWRGEYLHGAGIPRAVIGALASRLGHVLVATPDPDDDHGELLTLSSSRVALHDGCFIRLDPADPGVRNAFLATVFELHEYYLGSPVPVAGAALVRAHLRDGVTLELESDPRQHEFRLKHYPAGASWWARRRAPVELVRAGTTGQA